MKKERKENPAADEFISELLGRKEEKAEEIGDGELFGKGNLFDEPEEKTEQEEIFGKDILDFGREICVPKEAVLAFAKAMGKDAGEIIEIYQKGSCFDELMRRFNIAKKDTEVFEKIAGIRGIGKEEIKEEILGVLKKARFEKAVAEIEEANPGIDREIAEELAKFRIEAKKPRKDEKEKNEEEKKIRERLKEIDRFMAKHSSEGVETLDNSVIDEWENGVPLEKAFCSFMLIQENKRLLEEIEKMKQGKTMDDQRSYAREHSVGSVYSPVGNEKIDEFIEGLFREY